MTFNPWKFLLSPRCKLGVSSTIRNFCSTRSGATTTVPYAHFQPKKVLILTKLSRLEFEKLKHPRLNDAQLEEVLKKRGSDYSTLLYHHYIHKGCENRVDKCLREFGVETRVVNRSDYSEDNIDWADLIVTTGGDGTFLMAACRIQDREKPIVGFNTDPTRSEGYLCLPKKYSVNVRSAITKLFEGKFRWTFRKRIRTTLIGETVFKNPVELHDQQLEHPEFRFFDCLQEQHKSVSSDEIVQNPKKRVLPVLALNEVYLGECVSARVSYFEMAADNGEPVKTKNSGICASTGTGSTSWSYNINKASGQNVEELIQIMRDEQILRPEQDNKELSEKITQLFNDKLLFDSERTRMLYTIRDHITSYTLPYALNIKSRAFANRLEIRSRCFDACLVIDGGLSFSFNDGTVAILEMHESDALRTIVEIFDDDK